MFLLVLLAACSGDPKETGDSGDSDSGGDTGDSGDSDSGGDSGDSDTGEDSGAAERPVITSADAYCYLHTTGEDFWNGEAHCTATDPQGTDTLARGGTLTVLSDQGEIASYALAVDPDTGACSGAFREDADDVLCSTAASYTLRFVVLDEDDHASEPVEVTGRQQ